MKILKKGFLCTIVWIILEVLIFNYKELKIFINSSLDKNINVDLSKVTYINWDNSSELLVSQLDPMIVIKDIDTKVKNINLMLDMSKQEESMSIFYTSSPEEQFSADKMLVCNVKKGENRIQLDENVYSLRMDIGEEAGTELYDYNVTLNKYKFHFSLARMIAILAIYFGAIGLFRLQDSPDYSSLYEEQ